MENPECMPLVISSLFLLLFRPFNLANYVACVTLCISFFVVVFQFLIFCVFLPKLSYHHTAPVTLLYALREALSIVCGEGLGKIVERHRKCAEELRIGLSELGMELYVNSPANRLPTITSVKLPKEIDWKKIVEIGANEYVLY